MNSLDLYDFTLPVTTSDKPSSSTPNAEASSSSSATAEIPSSQPSLNEEVTQVIGQLGRFWGGVRKQSQTAFESARKDLGQVVSQAQKELEKLGQKPPVAQRDATSSEKTVESSDIPPEAASESSTATSSETLPVSSSSFFSRLQSSLPSNLTPTTLSSTLQRFLPENLQHGLNLENATADFSQLRATLAENILRVQQGTTIQQAEKLAEQYMHKGEALFKEAGEFLKDAVKVVPPEDGEGMGVVWDGTDVWTMPSPLQTDVARGSSRKGKDKESNVLFSVPRAAAKRADILLKKLRSDPEAVRKDPEIDDDVAVKELWAEFVKDEVDAQGGITGEVWTKRISDALEGHDTDADVKALTALRDQLVPTSLPTNTFWTRYFFRVHQIEREEERRKALLAGAHHDEDEDDFTWEDDDEAEGIGADAEAHMSHSQEAADTPVNMSSSTVNTPPAMNNTAAPAEVLQPAPAPAPRSSTSQTQTPVSMSPRESEDSYDVVSSGNVSSAGCVTLAAHGEVRSGGKERKAGDDGDDSDWE